MRRKIIRIKSRSYFLSSAIKLVGLTIILLILLKLLPKNLKLLQESVPNDSSNIELMIRKGNPTDTSWKNIVLKSCGTNLPNYRYSVTLPASWTVKKDIKEGHYIYDKFDSVFMAEGDGKSFQINCTLNGVGGDLCKPEDRVKFTVAGQVHQPCFGKVDGQWYMGVLNLNRDPVTQATISFWAHGLDIPTLNKLFSSFRILGNL